MMPSIAHVTPAADQMSGIRLIRYEATYKSDWDVFIGGAKNGVFLFQRDYMEYHADRFVDHSLLFYKGEKLLAVMPANQDEQTLVSHSGLTFGGVVSDGGMKAAVMLEVVDALLKHTRAQGFQRIVYKAVPHIYHHFPAEEDLYALHRFGARLYRRDLSSTIDIKERLPFSKGRRWAIKQALKHGVEVKESRGFEGFMAIESHVLGSRYGLKPVHSAAEIEMLARRFPENIKLFIAATDEELLGGVIVYESRQVAHAQYISATDQGKKIGAIDIVLNFLIEKYYAEKKYFDFGISTEDNGQYLNPGLVENKESFGARAIAYDFYELSLT